MIVDWEGNLIELAEDQNGHVLVLGQSGCGKTYFACREIEESLKQRKRVLVIDYSGSFTRTEMDKNKLKASEVMMLDPQAETLNWVLDYKNQDQAIYDIADALIFSLKITSYVQRKLIKQCVAETMLIFGEISVRAIMQWLETEYDIKKDDPDIGENLMRLLTKLSTYDTSTPISITVKPGSTHALPKLTVLQLSGLAEIEKSFWCQMFLELLWKETTHDRTRRRCERLVLDEIQALSLDGGRAFAMMLEQGRKHNLNVLAITQHLTRYTKTEIDYLLQARNLLFFRPTPASREFCAKMIDPERIKVWSEKLARLDIGQMVLVGKYTVNYKKTILTKALLCKVVG